MRRRTRQLIGMRSNGLLRSLVSVHSSNARSPVSFPLALQARPFPDLRVDDGLNEVGCLLKEWRKREWWRCRPTIVPSKWTREGEEGSQVQVATRRSCGRDSQ